MRTQIHELINTATGVGKALERAKKRKEHISKFLTLLNTVLPILSSAVTTYSLFDYSNLKIYILVILAVLSALVATYISFSEYAATLERYEITSAVYIQIGKNLKQVLVNKNCDYMNGFADANGEIIMFLNGISNNLEHSSIQSTHKRLQNYYSIIKSQCCDADTDKLPSYLKNNLEHGLFFHVFLKNGTINICDTHGDAYSGFLFKQNFKFQLERGDTFETEITSFDSEIKIVCIPVSGESALCVENIFNSASDEIIDPSDYRVDIEIISE